MVSKQRIKKQETVQYLQERLKEAKSVILTDYRGLNMAQLSELRKKLRDSNAEFVVTKNTLLARALKLSKEQSDKENVRQAFFNPTAAIFAYGDEISPLKALAGFIKAVNLPQIKLGILGKDILSSQRVEELAKLPPREVLIGKTISTIASPLYGLVFTLKGNLNNLVYALNAIKNKKGGV